MSCATKGGTKNWNNNLALREDDFTCWNKVVKLTPSEREKLFSQIPNRRFLEKDARNLEKVFQLVKNKGGPEGVRREYERLSTADERIKYLDDFPGIGDKYARNIPMDCADPLFAGKFALDHRLKTILKTWARHLGSYKEMERYLGDVAAALQVDTWILDRFLYQQYEEVKRRLVPEHRQGGNA